MTPEINALFEMYPLPSSWTSPEVFSDQLDCEGVQCNRVGLTAQSADGKAVSASAAQQGEIPWRRAYFELIERCAVVSAPNSVELSFPLVDKAGQPTGERIATNVLFPESGEGWRYSLSNGVAAHTSYEAAAESAWLELVERDQILRSWYGIGAEIRHGKPLWLDSLSSDFPRNYGVDAYLLGSINGIDVVGVFCFPQNEMKEAPFVYGFGARRGLKAAMQNASNEALQRLSFLWGEDWKSPLPELSPTAAYHQEVYLRPEGMALVQRWLKGERFEPNSNASRAEKALSAAFADLTPAHLRGKVAVVKAICPDLMPLVFGYDPAALARGAPREFLIHPIA